MNASATPGMARAHAKRSQQVKEARRDREDGNYQATRAVRCGWRNRWWTVPTVISLAAWGLVGAEAIRGRRGGQPPTLSAWGLAALATVGAAGWILFSRFNKAAWTRRRVRRLELAFRHRWEDAMRDLSILSPRGRVHGKGRQPPRVVRQRKGVPSHLREPAIKLVDGTVDATVHLPLRLEESKLVNPQARLHNPIVGNLFLPGGLGIPEFTQVWEREVNGARWWNVRCEYRRAPGVGELNHWGFRPAPDDFSLRIGAGPQGENIIDLLASPHVRVYGPPRAGKGQLALDALAQGVLRGWLVLIINGSGAPEWNDWQNSGLPNVQVVRCSLRDAQAGAVAVSSAMHDLLTIAEVRDRVCDQYGAHGWHQLDEPVRLAHPRVFCVFDEPSSLLKLAGKPGNMAGGLMEMVARTGPKYGITLMPLDQIINVTASAISGPTLEVMRGVVWVGDQPGSAARDRVGGFVGWPPAPPGKGGAVSFNFGTPGSSKQVRMPYHSPADLRRFLAEQRALWLKP